MWIYNNTLTCISFGLDPRQCSGDSNQTGWTPWSKAETSQHLHILQAHQAYLKPKLCIHLTHYQTTNFRLFQIERVCRRQFHIWRKFPIVFKRLVSQGRQKVSLCGNGLTLSLLMMTQEAFVDSVDQDQTTQKGIITMQVQMLHCGALASSSIASISDWWPGGSRFNTLWYINGWVQNYSKCIYIV